MSATGSSPQPAAQGRRKEVIGMVISNRMQKTIVVEAVRQKTHSFYGRVVAKAKKFYAHDERGEAHVGDFVRLEETRPLSKLKRWRLKQVIRRATLAVETTETETAS